MSRQLAQRGLRENFLFNANLDRSGGGLDGCVRHFCQGFERGILFKQRFDLNGNGPQTILDADWKAKQVVAADFGSGFFSVKTLKWIGAG